MYPKTRKKKKFHLVLSLTKNYQAPAMGQALLEAPRMQHGAKQTLVSFSLEVTIFWGKQMPTR